MNLFSKELIFSTIAIALVTLVFVFSGPAFGLRMLAEITCFALIALGLSVQWGYAGLFNAGVMGFIAIAAFASMLMTFPVNMVFWQSENPMLMLGIVGKLLLAVIIIYILSRLHHFGLSKRWRNLLMTIAIAITYFIFVASLDPVAKSIESSAGFIGGFGLPVWIGWLTGGLIAGVLAWAVGHICLDLRSDYLAIATLGIAEIIKALLKNADWLTHGTLTVSPLPWPVPTAGDVGFITARGLYLAVMAILVALVYWLLQRAYQAPWGRMIRAIRDNEVSAASMGKNINQRRMEVFILGAVLMGVGGAALVTFAGIFDPSGFLPLHHTFLIWVMVILGGAGNNLGTLVGTVIVYVVWTMSEPATLALFESIKTLGEDWFNWKAPAQFESRALQMRVFIIGLTITLVLRFAPNGVIPEKIPKHE